MSNLKKLQEAKQRLEKLLYPEEYNINIEEIDVDEEVKSIFDSLDDISMLYESEELKPIERKLYTQILNLNREFVIRKWNDLIKDYEAIDQLCYSRLYSQFDLSILKNIVSNITELKVNKCNNNTLLKCMHPKNEELYFSIEFEQSTLDSIYESLFGESLEEAKRILNLVDEKDFHNHNIINVRFRLINFIAYKTLKTGLKEEQFKTLITQLEKLLQQAEKSI